MNYISHYFHILFSLQKYYVTVYFVLFLTVKSNVLMHSAGLTHFSVHAAHREDSLYNVKVLTRTTKNKNSITMKMICLGDNKRLSAAKTILEI